MLLRLPPPVSQLGPEPLDLFPGTRKFGRLRLGASLLGAAMALGLLLLRSREFGGAHLQRLALFLHAALPVCKLRAKPLELFLRVRQCGGALLQCLILLLRLTVPVGQFRAEPLALLA